MADYPPITRTIERNVAGLLLICRLIGIKLILRLTAEQVASFRRRYLERAREKGRDETGAKIMYNSHPRSAASLFSKQMLAAYKVAGVEVMNPFAGQMLRRIELKPYTPLPRDLLDSIWSDSAKLQDGDPDAPAPSKPAKQKRRKPPKGKLAKSAKRKVVRWNEPDSRKPHSEAYSLLLLELGIDLRREEGDKPLWD